MERIGIAYKYRRFVGIGRCEKGSLFGNIFRTCTGYAGYHFKGFEEHFPGHFVVFDGGGEKPLARSQASKAGGSIVGDLILNRSVDEFFGELGEILR